jgi:hypothetical protein
MKRRDEAPDPVQAGVPVKALETRPKSARPLKVTTFTVRATREQARRWALVARYLKCRSVCAWLEELAEEQAQRIEPRLPRTPPPRPAPR